MSAGLVAWKDRARDMLNRLNTMQPPNVVLQQVTMLGEARSIIEAALAAAPAADGWRPIESAPKDGTRIMLAVVDGRTTPYPLTDYYIIATWDGEHSTPYVPTKWTHWMPLPAAPKPQGEG